MLKRSTSAALIIFATAGIACAKASPSNADARRAESSTASSARLAAQTPSTIWDDGLAEVAVYDAHWNIYGKDRTFGARLITAKEAFDMDRHVKADPPYEGRSIRDVLKENLIMEIQTENYPYRFLRTVFVSHEDPASLVKETVGSQEWCGNTFQEYRSWTSPTSREFHSYFDGEGDGVENIDLRPNDLFRDQLFSTLRFTADDTTEKRIRLWPSLVTNRAKPMRPLEGVLRRSGPETIRAAGRDWSCRRFDIEAEGLNESYWFSADDSRVLVRYESSDGSAFLLKEIQRRDYWTRR